jgi:catechol 2,3-dioxygenase-like lactoylglutathione lyase family enzyme
MSLVGPVKRVTLWVRDAEASLRLYRDVLELEVVEDKVIEGAGIAALVGLEDVRLRIVHLASGGHEDGWIGLYEASRVRPPMQPMPAAPDPAHFAYGQAVVVFNTNHLGRIMPRLEAGGYRYLRTPASYVKPTTTGPTPAGVYTEAIFFDPDGIPVSLIGYAPLPPSA